MLFRPFISCFFDYKLGARGDWYQHPAAPILFLIALDIFSIRSRPTGCYNPSNNEFRISFIRPILVRTTSHDNSYFSECFQIIKEKCIHNKKGMESSAVFILCADQGGT